MNKLEIKEIQKGQLIVYAQIPIAFIVTSVLKVELVNNGLGGIILEEEPIEEPYKKNYDLPPHRGPIEWTSKYNIQNWGFFLAVVGSLALGAATVAFNTNGVNLLEGRKDLSVLWDIRVHPEHRRKGIGRSLFDHATNWSRIRECTQMKIETQNINVTACNFYQKMGCTLGEIHRFAYQSDPEIKNEVMLNWFIDL